MDIRFARRSRNSIRGGGGNLRGAQGKKQRIRHQAGRERQRDPARYAQDAHLCRLLVRPDDRDGEAGTRELRRHELERPLAGYDSLDPEKYREPGVVRPIYHRAAAQGGAPRARRGRRSLAVRRFAGYARTHVPFLLRSVGW